MSLHHVVELGPVHGHVVFGSKSFRQFDQETIGLMQVESVFPGNDRAACLFCRFQKTFKTGESFFDDTQKLFFFFFDRALHVFNCFGDVGVRSFHNLNNGRDQPVQKRFMFAQQVSFQQCASQ